MTLVLVSGAGAYVGCGNEQSTVAGVVDESDAAAAIDSASDAEIAVDATALVDASTPSDSGSESDAEVEVDATLLAPTFDTINLRDGGGLTLNWTNHQPDCDGVEAQRKDALHPYALIVTTAGTAITTDDPTATANLAYTYDLRCKKGSSFSSYSNELARNPQN